MEPSASHIWSDGPPAPSSAFEDGWDSETVSPRIPISPAACHLWAQFSLGEEQAEHRHNMSGSAADASAASYHYSNAVPPEKEFNPYWGYIAGGFFFFTVVHYLTGFAVPAAAGSTRKAQWKWRNVATSLVHSTITGLWAVVAFYQDPSMCDDMIYAFTHSAHMLISFSIGYFIYDFFDMWLYHPKRSTYELLVHHACVISCFAIAASTRLYLPYASLALVVEINSVFLHIRQLFIIQGYPAKSSMTYR